MSAKNCRILLKQITSNTLSKSFVSKFNQQTIISTRAFALTATASSKSISSSAYKGRRILHFNEKALILYSTKCNQSSQIARPYVDPKLSYSFGRSNEYLVHSTIDEDFKQKVREKPDEIAFVIYYENKEVTFKQLDEDVNKISKALIKKLNVKKGDYVGIFAYNSYHWLATQFACTRIGAILTPINPSYKSHELAYILKKGKVKCLFMPGPKSNQAELNDHLNVLQDEKIISMSNNGELQLQNIVLMDDENRYNIISDASDNIEVADKSLIRFKFNKCKMHNWADAIETNNDGVIFKSIEEAKEAGVDESEACVIDPSSISPDDMFAVYYTSGTTGNPKGACISQFSVVNNVRFCQARIRQGRAKTWRTNSATTLPMFHIFAGVLNTLSPIYSNCRVIYSSYRYDIQAYVDSIMKYEANTVALTPTILIDMLAYIEKNKITNVPLKIVQSGGAALLKEIIARTFKTLPELEELRTGYGSTENGAVATLQSIHEPADFKALTVGQALDFTELRVVKPGTNEIVELGERGEIQTRGHNKMLGYLEEKEKTDEVITKSGWYRTGDLGIMYPHGSIEISGRLKHLIIKGGENIYPEEVEQLLLRLDYIEDVHVVGVPDKRFGEQVCAWIKLKPSYTSEPGDSSTERALVSKEEIIQFCKDNITYFKVPKYVLFVDEFPTTPTKKVQNHLMAEKSIEILKLQDQM